MKIEWIDPCWKGYFAEYAEYAELAEYTEYTEYTEYSEYAKYAKCAKCAKYAYLDEPHMDKWGVPEKILQNAADFDKEKIYRL